jgi:hypothetical protein
MHGGDREGGSRDHHEHECGKQPPAHRGTIHTPRCGGEEVTMREDWQLLPEDDFEDDEEEDEDEEEEDEGGEEEEEGTWYVSTKLSTSLDFSPMNSL